MRVAGVRGVKVKDERGVGVAGEDGFSSGEGESGEESDEEEDFCAD